MAFVTDSNRPQPLWHPPPAACLTAAGAAAAVPSLLLRPPPPPPRGHTRGIVRHGDVVVGPPHVPVRVGDAPAAEHAVHREEGAEAVHAAEVAEPQAPGAGVREADGGAEAAVGGGQALVHGLDAGLGEGRGAEPGRETTDAVGGHGAVQQQHRVRVDGPRADGACAGAEGRGARAFGGGGGVGLGFGGLSQGSQDAWGVEHDGVPISAGRAWGGGGRGVSAWVGGVQPPPPPPLRWCCETCLFEVPALRIGAVGRTCPCKAPPRWKEGGTEGIIARETSVFVVLYFVVPCEHSCDKTQTTGKRCFLIFLLLPIIICYLFFCLV